MQRKRLLLLTDDRFLGRFYDSKLQKAGFAVRTAETAGDGLALLEAEEADLIIVDGLLRDNRGTDAVEILRSRPAGSVAPILVLPTPHFALAQRLGSYPGTRLLTNEGNMLGELVKVATEMLGLPEHDGASLMVATMPEDEWKQQAIVAAHESLSELRSGLHQMSREPESLAPLREILRAVHHFAGRTSLLNRTALSHIARAVECLVYTLDRLADRVDPLTLRTMGQAADFLALLLDDKNYSRIPDFDSARIVVVEDEASARELIITAMQMVGLRASGSDSPQRGLSVLGAEACDLIFLDINLPEMNGFELCNKVRALPLHERTPIVFLTGMASFQNRVQSSLSGGNDFVGKPFNVAELGVKALIWVMKGRLGLN